MGETNWWGVDLVDTSLLLGDKLGETRGWGQRQEKLCGSKLGHVSC